MIFPSSSWCPCPFILWIISVVPTPGGFGFKEIVMIGMYTMVRVPINIASIVSVLTELFICFL